MHDALSMILDDDFGLSDGEESDFEGEEVCGYRPECHLNLGAGRSQWERDRGRRRSDGGWESLLSVRSG